MRSLGHAAGFRNAKMHGGLGGVGGLALFLGKYAVFQTAARPPSGGVEGDQRSVVRCQEFVGCQIGKKSICKVEH